MFERSVRHFDNNEKSLSRRDNSKTFKTISPDLFAGLAVFEFSLEARSSGRIAASIAIVTIRPVSERPSNAIIPDMEKFQEKKRFSCFLLLRLSNLDFQNALFIRLS